ncbi:MAG: Abi family protein [Candidatus Margulisbacteria bacterium]|jgi:abortive infection bacteriophage resistance protein|nr:Abi family protein [Candidatus Margulisiibacteriota bacterium]
MQYGKPPLSFEQQADLLIGRGLIADKAFLVKRLQQVNYYRLSGYLYPYRQPDNTFQADTAFEKIWRHYTFDRRLRLRLIVMDAIERVEVSIKTQLVYALSMQTGAFGYTAAQTFPNLKVEDYTNWLNKVVTKEVNRSKETFVSHFRAKYGDTHKFLPLWMLSEIMSFGCVLTMYRGVTTEIKKEISASYGVPDLVLTSWLHTISVIRNTCAHHCRLWNRELGVKPLLPNKHKYPQWHVPVAIPQNRIFGVLTILRYWLSIIAPQSKWTERLLDLLDEYPEISRGHMGFPDNWTDSPLWQ